MRSFDVVVAGLGAMGSAALYHLARRGVSVLGLDPFEVPHDQGSSGGDTRLIRKAYFEHPDYVPLLERAYRNWEDLEADSGQRLLYRTGTLYLGPESAELMAGSRASATRHGVSLEPLAPDEVARRFPGFRCPQDYQALFEPDAGFLLCGHAIAASVAGAGASGATVAAGERLLGWRGGSGGLEIETDRGRYRAGSLVLAPGAWSGPLLRDLGLELTVTRQALFWVHAPVSGHLELGRAPCWAVQRPDAPGLFYGLPALPGALGVRRAVKIGHHAPGEVVDPDSPRRVADAAELDAVLASLGDCVDGLRGPAADAHVCLYTNSPDGHFVVDTHPDQGNVVFACGFSGHGFKFASVIGEVLADLALEGDSALPIGFLRRR